MTPSLTETVTPTKPCGWQEPWGVFAKWAAGRLGLLMEFDGQSYQLRQEPPPEPHEKPARSGLGSALLHRRRPEAADLPAGDRYDSPAALARELLERLSRLDPPAALAPVGQPERVHELAPSLLSAYQVDEGRVHIAGCHFEDVPFVRMTTVVDSSGEPAFAHELHDATGDAVSERLASELGLRDTRELDYHPRTPCHGIAPRGGGADAPLCSAVVWAKRVSGNLQFTIGDATLTAPFEGWASTLEPPEVTCPRTGRPTRRLTAVEEPGADKRVIVAAEEAERCEESGRQLLAADLVTCAATGRRVAPDLCERCPVSGEWTLKEEFVPCTRCGQRVGKASQLGGRCHGCRRMRRVRGGDPTLAAILAAYPTLNALGRWRLSETDSVYLLQGSRMLARYLLVLDRETLGVVTASRLTPLGGAVELSPAERLSLLAC